MNDQSALAPAPQKIGKIALRVCDLDGRRLTHTALLEGTAHGEHHRGVT